MAVGPEDDKVDVDNRGLQTGLSEIPTGMQGFPHDGCRTSLLVSALVILYLGIAELTLEFRGEWQFGCGITSLNQCSIRAWESGPKVIQTMSNMRIGLPLHWVQAEPIWQYQ